MIGMDAHTGRASSGLAHLQQSIADILLTPIGTRVMRREYGSLVPELLDHPLHGANVLRLYAATAYALQRWEPRIKVSSVALQVDMQGAVALDLDCTAAGKDLQVSVELRSA